MKRKDAPESKKHLHPRRIKTEPVAEAGIDTFMQMFVTSEVDRTKIESQHIKQYILTAKTEQLNKFVLMLANPHLPEESKAVIADLLTKAANGAKKLKLESHEHERRIWWGRGCRRGLHGRRGWRGLRVRRGRQRERQSCSSSSFEESRNLLPSSLVNVYRRKKVVLMFMIIAATMN